MEISDSLKALYKDTFVYDHKHRGFTFAKSLPALQKGHLSNKSL